MENPTRQEVYRARLVYEDWELRSPSALLEAGKILARATEFYEKEIERLERALAYHAGMSRAEP